MGKKTVPSTRLLCDSQEQLGNARLHCAARGITVVGVCRIVFTEAAEPMAAS